MEQLEERSLLAAVTFTHTFEGLWDFPSMSGDGNRIAFFSRADWTGENPGGNGEIFLYEVSSDTLAQVTDSGTRLDAVSTRPSISSDGTRIAFASNLNLTDSNAEQNFEIFLYDTSTNAFTQVTNTVLRNDSGDYLSISGDGTKIAFLSDADLTGQNADENEEIFLFDTLSGSFTQITDSTGRGNNIWGVSIDADGTRIALSSRLDLAGNNPNGDRESFYFDTTTEGFTQVTNGGALSAHINGDGTKIAIYSSSNLTGDNVDRNLEVFLFDTTTSDLVQVTDTIDVDNRNPIISSDGTKILFNSTGNLTGENADGNAEVFLFDTRIERFTQLTDTTVAGGPPTWLTSVNSDGTQVVLGSYLLDETYLATITYPVVPGDYNGNGMVEQADLDLVLLNWGESFEALPGEWVNERPTSGIVDQAELDAVLLNWGATGASVEPAAEPAAFTEGQQIPHRMGPGWSIDETSGPYIRHHGMGYGEMGQGAGYHHDDMDDSWGFGDRHLAGEHLHDARLRAQSALRATRREELFASMGGEDYPGFGHGMHAHAGDLNDAWHLPMAPVDAADGHTHDGWPAGHMLAPFDNGWAGGICGDAAAHDEFFSSFGHWRGRRT